MWCPVCIVRARKRARESGRESGGWDLKILEKQVKYMRERAREEASASASSDSDDWESA